MGNTYPTQHNHENLRKVVGAEYTIFMSLEKQGARDKHLLTLSRVFRRDVVQLCIP